MPKKSRKDNSNTIQLPSIDGWPAHLAEYPNFSRQYSYTSVSAAGEINYEQRRIFDEIDNIYAVFATVIKFHDNGLYPPVWALDEIVDRIKKHLKAPTPDLFASQFGVSGRSSGSTNPHEEYQAYILEQSALTDMAVLLRGFFITTDFAARASISKNKLRISAKTLVNRFNDDLGSSKLHKRTKSTSDDIDPFHNIDEVREGYIREFPEEIQKKLRRKISP